MEKRLNVKVPNKFPIVEKKPKIAFIGEAPGAEEERMLNPFIGPSGSLLEDIARACGVMRSGCFVGNVYQYRPPNNDISLIDKTSERWLDSINTLKVNLETFKPDIIIALGETAMETLTGKKSVFKYRGTVLPCTLVPGLKVLPTFHPAFILRVYSNKHILKLDIAKAKEEAAFPGLNYPVRTKIVNPSFETACEHLEAYCNVDYLAIDFETTRGMCVPKCIGLAHKPDYAICIPFGQYTPDQEAEIFALLDKCMRGKAKKIFHNATFDLSVFAYWLHIFPENLWMDTMLAFRACYPELKKSLAFVSSIFTREPYYKNMRDEVSDDEESEKSWSDKAPKEVLWDYNCIDCCVTLESALALDKELDDLKARPGYSIMMDLVEVSLYMTLRGIKIDEPKRIARLAELETKIEAQSKFISEIFGREINVKSVPDMKKLLYEDLNLPKVYVDGRLSTSADTLLELARKTKSYDLQLLLKLRQARTQKSFYDLDTLTTKGVVRLHSGFHVGGTETGRWASSDSILGGRNLLNIPEDRRDIYIPDEGKVFLGFDKAQAEARVVAYKSYICTGDNSYLDLILSKTKIHVWLGQRFVDRGIFKCKKEDIKSGTTEYYIAKKCVHGFSYDMGTVTFCKVVANETDGEIVIEPAMARRVKETLHMEIPAIPKWHIAVQEWLRQGNRRMVNCFGRSRLFFGRWGDELFGEAYAFEPQSTVADDINTTMLRIWREVPEFDILQQNYDSILGQVDEGKWQEVLEKLKPIAQQKLKLTSFDNHRSIELTIPVEFKMGKNWQEMETVG